MVEESNYSFSDILLILSRELKLIIITPIILCSVMIFYLIFFSEPVYTSTAKIMSSSTTGTLSQTAGIAAQLGINFSVPQSEPKWFYPEIIKSRDLAKNLLKKRFNTNKYGSQKTLLQILTYGNQKPKLNMNKLEAIGVNNLLQLVDASEDIKTGIVTVAVTSFEPALSAEINKAFLYELDSHQLKYNKAKMSEAKQFIEERILIIEKELMAAEEDLKIFNDRNRRIENSPALQLEQQRLGREVTVLIGVFTTLKQQLETTKIEEVKESDYVIIIDSPETPLKRSKPKKKLMVILAGLLGLSFSILIAFVKELILNSSKKEKVKMNQVKLHLYKNISELIPKRGKS